MSEVQLKSLVLIPKLTGGLSMLGSSIVCWDILKDRKTKLKKVYHRLLFTMSFMDIFLSFSLFLSTWPIPKDTPGAPWLAAGNDATCTAQGFAQVFFMPALFYNAYLSIYYVLVIVYGWPESKLVSLEYWAHGFTLLFSCVTAFTALALDMYGSNFLVWCFITGSWNIQLAINIAWQWAAWVVVFVMMGFLCWKVGKQYRTTQKYGEANIRRSIRERLQQDKSERQQQDQSESGERSSMFFVTPRRRRQSMRESWFYRRQDSMASSGRNNSTKNNPMRLIKSQAALYSLSYLLTESSNIAVSIAYYTSEPVGNVPVWVLQYALITIPLQGFWNCLIYFRPKFLKYRQERAKRRKELLAARRTAATTSGSNFFQNMGGEDSTTNNDRAPQHWTSAQVIANYTDNEADKGGENTDHPVEEEEANDVEAAAATAACRIDNDDDCLNSFASATSQDQAEASNRNDVVADEKPTTSQPDDTTLPQHTNVEEEEEEDRKDQAPTSPGIATQQLFSGSLAVDTRDDDDRNLLQQQAVGGDFQFTFQTIIDKAAAALGCAPTASGAAITTTISKEEDRTTGNAYDDSEHRREAQAEAVVE